MTDTTSTRPLPVGCKMDHPSKYASDETCDVCGLGEGDACKAYDDQVASRRSNRSVPTRPQMGDEFGNVEITALHRHAASLFLFWPMSLLAKHREAAITDEEAVEKLAEFISRWEDKGVRASLPQPTAGSTGEADALRIILDKLNRAVSLIEGPPGLRLTESQRDGVMLVDSARTKINTLINRIASTPAQSVLVEDALKALEVAEIALANSLPLSHEQKPPLPIIRKTMGKLRKSIAALSHAPLNAELLWAAKKLNGVRMVDNLSLEDCRKISRIIAAAESASPQPDRESEHSIIDHAGDCQLVTDIPYGRCTCGFSKRIAASSNRPQATEEGK